MTELRGNVGTRLSRLDENRFDALLLACAGLKRLGLAARIRETLEADRFVPAPGQGIIGIECRDNDSATHARVHTLNDGPSATRLAAERALNAKLGGSCRAPVAGHARVLGSQLQLTGLVGRPDGSRIVKDSITGPAASAAELGVALAERLLAAGGAEILRELGARHA